MRRPLRTGLRFPVPLVAPPTVLNDRNIAWVLPLLNADGTPFVDPLGVLVYRSSSAITATNYADLIASGATLINDPYTGPAALVYRDEEATPGITWYYALVVLDAEGTPSDPTIQTPRLYTS